MNVMSLAKRSSMNPAAPNCFHPGCRRRSSAPIIQSVSPFTRSPVYSSMRLLGTATCISCGPAFAASVVVFACCAFAALNGSSTVARANRIRRVMAPSPIVEPSPGRIVTVEFLPAGRCGSVGPWIRPLSGSVDVAERSQCGTHVLEFDDVVRHPVATEERRQRSAQSQEREPAFTWNGPDPVRFKAIGNVRTEEDIDRTIVVDLRSAVPADRCARTIFEHGTADGVVHHDRPEQSHGNSRRQPQPVDIRAVEVLAAAVAWCPEVLRG